MKDTKEEEGGLDSQTMSKWPFLNIMQLGFDFVAACMSK